MDNDKNLDNDPQLFDDNDEEFSTNYVIPDLCLSCKIYPDEDFLEKLSCMMTRFTQQKEEVFLCAAYTPVSPSVDKETVIRALCAKAGIVYPGDIEDNDDSIQF